MMSSIPKCNERGVALLLTLGVLSLLLILSMSFAFTARTDMRAAQINADMVKARLLCESGLERVLGFLSYSFDGSNPGDVFPATSDAGLFTDTNAGPGVVGSHNNWASRSYMYSTLPAANADQTGIDEALATDLNNGFEFIPANASDATALGDTLSWHHIEDGDGNLIGRLAFVAVDESGKLDPGALVTADHEPFHDANGNGQYDAGETFFDINGDGSFTNSDVEETTEERLGLSPQEIAVHPDFLAEMPSNSATLQRIPWMSWVHMNNVLGLTAVDVFFPRSFDVEAWDDAGTDRHRYDLRNANWDAPGGGGPQVTVANLQANASPFSGANTGGIPWISGLQSESDFNGDGTVDAADHDLLRDQVAANLIDYSDVDHNPTNDYSNTAGSATDMSSEYCGLEKVAFINEVLLQVTWEVAGSGHSLKITPALEFINMWDSASTPERMAMEVEFSFDGGSGELEWDESLGGSVAAGRYDDSGMLGTESKAFAANGDVSIGNFQITALRVAIGNAAGNVTTRNLMDFAEISSSETSSLEEGTAKEITARVTDPRANHLIDAWTWEDFDSTGTYSLGTANPGADPSAGDDAETLTDPADGISTAFIRNLPMQTPWELGAIHRGEAWRTINLKAYNDGGAGATYAYGDGRLLDQIKIGGQTEVKGRINVNSPVQDIWEYYVLRWIRVGCGYNSPATGGVAVSNLGDLAAGILLANGGTAAAAFGGRGGICAAAALADSTCGVTQDTDAKQEEIIGKIAHLLTARQNYFNVIVVAQAIKDLGNVDPGDGDPDDEYFSYDGGSNYCSILAEQKIKAVVYRDAFQNTYEVKRYEFLED